MNSGFGDLDCRIRLELLRLPSMAYRRARVDMLEVYKYCENKYKVDHKLLQHSTDDRTRGHIKKLKPSTCTSRVRHFFFTQRVVKLWNKLPENVVSAPSMNCFKNKLDSHLKDNLDDVDFCCY